MSIKWNLKKYIAEKHSIYSATELKKIITKKTGIIISLQNICNYLNATPKMIRPETIEIICSALSCELNDFCRITPSDRKKKENEKLSYQSTPLSNVGWSISNPQDYRQWR
jgi:DNA-binding Xre family transcriptional regulator